MTAIISRRAVSPLGPVNATLAVMRARHGQGSLQGLVPGLVAHDVTESSGRPAEGSRRPMEGSGEPGWTRAAQLRTAEGMALFLDTATRRWNAQPHAAAALAWKCYSYWLTLPAVIGYAAARRVPLMTPERVLVRYSANHPFLTLGLHDPVTAILASDPIAVTDAPGLLVVADETELLEVLRASLVEHLDPMVDRIREQVHIGHRTLWGSVAAGVAYGLSRAADAIPGSALEIANTVLTALDAADLVELTARPEGGLRIQRRTCCLAFTLPQPKICTSCCIRAA